MGQPRLQIGGLAATSALVLGVLLFLIAATVGPAAAAAASVDSCEAPVPSDDTTAAAGGGSCSATVPASAAPPSSSSTVDLAGLADTPAAAAAGAVEDDHDHGEMLQQVAPPSNYTPRYHSAEEAAAADTIPLPVIRQPLAATTPMTLTPEEERAYLQSLYDAPKGEQGRTMRTPRPQHKPQPPPKAIHFNTSNVHELTPTPINLRYIPNFMTADECRHFIKLSDELGTRRSPVLLEDGVYDFNSSKRTSTTTFLPTGYDPVVETLEWRIARLTNVDKARVSMFQIVRYDPYQRFYGHFDGNGAVPLRYTIFAYLNDIAYGEGGETDFPELGMRFQPQQGNAVFWENACPQKNRRAASLHQGLPPTHQRKYGPRTPASETRVRPPFGSTSPPRTTRSPPLRVLFVLPLPLSSGLNIWITF